MTTGSKRPSVTSSSSPSAMEDVDMGWDSAHERKVPEIPKAAAVPLEFVNRLPKQAAPLRLGSVVEETKGKGPSEAPRALGFLRPMHSLRRVAMPAPSGSGPSPHTHLTPKVSGNGPATSQAKRGIKPVAREAKMDDRKATQRATARSRTPAAAERQTSASKRSTGETLRGLVRRDVPVPAFKVLAVTEPEQASAPASSLNHTPPSEVLPTLEPPKVVQEETVLARAERPMAETRWDTEAAMQVIEARLSMGSVFPVEKPVHATASRGSSSRGRARAVRALGGLIASSALAAGALIWLGLKGSPVGAGGAAAASHALSGSASASNAPAIEEFEGPGNEEDGATAAARAAAVIAALHGKQQGNDESDSIGDDTAIAPPVRNGGRSPSDAAQSLLDNRGAELPAEIGASEWSGELLDAADQVGEPPGAVPSQAEPGDAAARHGSRENEPPGDSISHGSSPSESISESDSVVLKTSRLVSGDPAGGAQEPSTEAP